tara:strand:+ start:6432 stop:6611 length:180 start_codon:yes stop_codon:yes gene_type:complete
MTYVDLVYASDCEEFFYNDGDIPVSEGQLIGVDIYLEDRVDLILLDDIYWKPNHEEETE